MAAKVQYKELSQVSSSFIMSFADCEQRAALERLAGEMKPPTPHQFVYGSFMHWAYGEIWKHKLEKGVMPKKEIIFYYARVHLPKLFEQGDRDGRIQWLTSRQKKKLSVEEQIQKVADLKQLYFSRAHLGLSAVYEHCFHAHPGVEVQIEVEIKNVTSKALAPWSLEYLLSGRIDVLAFWKNVVDIIDLKTGDLLVNQSREKIVKNVQMTLYRLAIAKMYPGFRVGKIYFQGLDISKELIEKYGKDALKYARVYVDERNQEHFEDFANIVDDIQRITHMLANPNRYNYGDFEDWEALSHWGKLADFKRNVLERRYIPRVGPWCESRCPFLDRCRELNKDDWNSYDRLHGQMEAKVAEGETVEPFRKEVIELQPLLPQIKRQHAPSRKKALVAANRKMKDSGQFPKPLAVASAIKKIHRQIPAINGVLCPCRQADRIPLGFLELVPEFLRLKQQPNLASIGKACTWKECPFKCVDLGGENSSPPTA